MGDAIALGDIVRARAEFDKFDAGQQWKFGKPFLFVNGHALPDPTLQDAIEALKAKPGNDKV